MQTPAELCREAKIIAINLRDIAVIEARSNPNLALPPNLRAAADLLCDLSTLVRVLCDKADATANMATMEERLAAVERSVRELRDQCLSGDFERG